MKFVPIFILSLLLVLLPLPGRAASDVLRVAFNPHPPWKILDGGGAPGGIDIEFLHLLAERMDLEVQFVRVPFKRGLKLLEYGEVDLMPGVLHSPEREAYAHYLVPAFRDRANKALYVLKGREDTITRYEDMYGMVIGTQLGSKYYPRFDADDLLNKSEVKNTDINIKMLLAGRIDAFIYAEDSGDYRLARLGLTEAIVKARYLYTGMQDVNMVLSKRSPLAPRLAEFNRTMRDLVESGEFERIRQAFLSANKSIPATRMEPDTK